MTARLDLPGYSVWRSWKRCLENIGSMSTWPANCGFFGLGPWMPFIASTRICFPSRWGWSCFVSLSRCLYSFSSSNASIEQLLPFTGLIRPWFPIVAIFHFFWEVTNKKESIRHLALFHAHWGAYSGNSFKERTHSLYSSSAFPWVALKGSVARTCPNSKYLWALYRNHLSQKHNIACCPPKLLFALTPRSWPCLHDCLGASGNELEKDLSWFGFLDTGCERAKGPILGPIWAVDFASNGNLKGGWEFWLVSDNPSAKDFQGKFKITFFQRHKISEAGSHL